MRRSRIGKLSVTRDFEYGRRAAENLALGYERVVPVAQGGQSGLRGRRDGREGSQQRACVQGGK